MNVVFELTAHHIERVGVNAHSPTCDESYIGRADRLCKIPKSVVFVPLARLRAVVEIPTCKVVSAIHVEDVRCRSNGLAVRTAHGLRGFEIGVFAGIDLAAFKLSVRRNGKIELHVYGVVRPFCRESLIVERIVYRKGEVLDVALYVAPFTLTLSSALAGLPSPSSSIVILKVEINSSQDAIETPLSTLTLTVCPF